MYLGPLVQYTGQNDKLVRWLRFSTNGYFYDRPSLLDEILNSLFTLNQEQGSFQGLFHAPFYLFPSFFPQVVQDLC